MNVLLVKWIHKDTKKRKKAATETHVYLAFLILSVFWSKHWNLFKILRNAFFFKFQKSPNLGTKAQSASWKHFFSPSSTDEVMKICAHASLHETKLAAVTLMTQHHLAGSPRSSIAISAQTYTWSVKDAVISIGSKCWADIHILSAGYYSLVSRTWMQFYASLPCMSRDCQMMELPFS